VVNLCKNFECLQKNEYDTQAIRRPFHTLRFRSLVSLAGVLHHLTVPIQDVMEAVVDQLEESVGNYVMSVEIANGLVICRKVCSFLS
jgi:hypothetical protein